jgi:hypothetical protein
MLRIIFRRCVRASGRFFRNWGCRIIEILRILGPTAEWLMIDALFWYTGLAVWCLIALNAVAVLVIRAHDRLIFGRGEYLEGR